MMMKRMCFKSKVELHGYGFQSSDESMTRPRQHPGSANMEDGVGSDLYLTLGGIGDVG